MTLGIDVWRLIDVSSYIAYMFLIVDHTRKEEVDLTEEENSIVIEVIYNAEKI